MVGFVDRYVAYRKAKHLFLIGWIPWIAGFLAMTARSVVYFAGR